MKKQNNKNTNNIYDTIDEYSKIANKYQDITHHIFNNQRNDFNNKIDSLRDNFIHNANKKETTATYKAHLDSLCNMKEDPKNALLNDHIDNICNKKKK